MCFAPWRWTFLQFQLQFLFNVLKEHPIVISHWGNMMYVFICSVSVLSTGYVVNINPFTWVVEILLIFQVKIIKGNSPIDNVKFSLIMTGPVEHNIANTSQIKLRVICCVF